jgi:release factor glutamine methyltransferase
VLDACTGSGCVAISIKAGHPDCDVTASDISKAALDIARHNAEVLLSRTIPHGKPIQFFQSDLLAEVQGKFDLIVSNPPYVPSLQIDRLSAEVRGEPRIALDGGPDGLDLIRRLISQAAVKLHSGGQLLIEASSEQTERIEGFLMLAGFSNFTLRHDLEGRDRVFGGRIP